MVTRADLNDVNFRAVAYWIAHTRSACEHCGTPTGVVALCLPPGHEVLDCHDDDDDGAAAAAGSRGAEMWSKAEHEAFVFNVGYLSDAVAFRLNECAAGYRFDNSNVGGYWANHCERCGCLLSDDGLFCEPGGAFFPVSVMSAVRVRLLLIEEAIEVSAGGYAAQIPFFDAALKG